MKKKMEWHMILFFIVAAMESLAANFAHPITPTLIQELQLPDYSFGVLFAGMAFTNFLFSPLWARQVKMYGCKTVLGICCIGYGVGQFLFSIMTTLPTILFARLLSGFFVGGIGVGILTYIIHESDISHRGSLLALSATITTVFSAFGYMVGGFAGLISIKVTFLLQSGTLIGCGICFYLFLHKEKIERQESNTTLLEDINPFKAFMDIKDVMTVLFAILFFVVFLTSTASTAYDQCFNYFIKDQFHLNSSYNGMIKAVVGFISLLANSTICLWLMHKTDLKKSIIFVFGIGGIFLTGVTLFVDLVPFIIMNLLFFGINAIYVPLIQDLCVSEGKKEDGDVIVGFYNAMKSLGMIIGALFAGFIYAFGPRLSFLYSALFFFIAAILMGIYVIFKQKKGNSFHS